MKIDVIRDLNTSIAEERHKKVLSPGVMEIKGKVVTEEDMLREELVTMSTVRIAERDITLPGLGNPKFQELAIALVASCRELWERPFKPFWLATANDMTVIPLCRPEWAISEQGADYPLDNWVISGISVGTINIIPQEYAGHPLTIQTLDDKKERVFLTDFVEMNATPVVTAISIITDGEPAKIYEIRPAVKISNLQAFKMPSPEIARINLDIDGKVEADGATELTPFGLYICTGDKVPAVT